MKQDRGNTSKIKKPDKPYPDFPLFAHATKRWAKKIRGKLHYFGPWDDWQAALEKYQRERDDLYAGRTPRVSPEGVTIRDLLNRFLSAKKILVGSGEITPRTFSDYYQTCQRVGEAFGLTRLVVDLASEDFEQLRRQLAKTRGPHALGNEIQRVRVLFKYAYDAGLIDRPVRYGPTFKRPSKKTMRKHRAEKGSRMFEPEELRKILGAAAPQMKAMILLGVNCGFGNTDCGLLPVKALDLEKGWVSFPRPKTGVDRRCPLWPETIAALKEVLEAKRPRPKREEYAGLVFLTRCGEPWARTEWIEPKEEEQTDQADQAGNGNGDDSQKPPKEVRVKIDSPISKEFAKVVKKLKIHRKGVNFYSLRHVAETIGGESRDQPAVDFIMGHLRDDMASVYRERISDQRLRDVVDVVKKWLFKQAADVEEEPGGYF